MVFLRPRHELTGAYDVPKSVIFRLSAIIQFPIIIPTTVAHIKHKFDSWRCLIKLHVEFEFASGPMIFVRVIPLNVGEKKWEIHSPTIITSTVAHISTQI